jgi:hypothetical protein
MTLREGRHHQWRVFFTAADEDMVGVQWRDEPISDDELAEWRHQFVCDVWVERREIICGPPVRLDR